MYCKEPSAFICVYPRLKLFLFFCFVALLAGLATAATPQRIISAAPSATEILYGVGAFPQVVAVSDFCSYPPAVKSLPRIGGWSTPTLERLASLRPDLIVLTDAQAPLVQDQLHKLGLNTLVTPSRTIQDVFTTMQLLGRGTGHEQQARELIATTRAALERVRSRARPLFKPTVLCVVDRTPGTLRDLYAATEHSYMGELIELAGGRMAAPASSSGYVRISEEAVLSLNPDIIIDMVQSAKGELAEDPQAVWQDLPELKAVRTGRIYPIRDEYLLHASQMIARSAVTLARLLHPEVPPRDWEKQ
jgi:iron complex transport system substrate-binding protein